MKKADHDTGVSWSAFFMVLCTRMRVLAIDPGYDRLGVAIMERGESGKEVLIFSTCISSDKNSPLPSRLHSLGVAIDNLLTEYAPNAVGIETIFFNKNQKTGIAVAEARGIILYLAQVHGCTVHEYGPQEIKVAVTGYGNSDKHAVMDMVKRLVPNVPAAALDDEYDAIAVGITTLAHTRGGI
ncbi:hypothetical protein COU16_03560 [Candidatus Kaiserbacteria bacterium CG10_big_fil_rev_8_21_14_0_10_47_16]|uniref:Crossover junction endodeoxyribonuclease RuvC n=1 Tax=Candidatus Kaiserbacteria bacterium CG10_big_fil_rev_8_21_14_0_10_47_16 TaxID=1974608 RepID=A0A2H0UDX0_9BACT|nr:MAG: hypothetical protein COU16_03560 [Candidatus Kaiserbacteria bacterium CG10_big_fil_rev_8_21_14_0_10_47_16]